MHKVKMRSDTHLLPTQTPTELHEQIDFYSIYNLLQLKYIIEWTTTNGQWIIIRIQIIEL